MFALSTQREPSVSLVCLASTGSAAQILNTFKLSVLKPENGRKPAPASIIYPLFIQNNSAEARETGNHSVSYRNLFDDLDSWWTAQRQDLRHSISGAYELALTAQGAVCVCCPAIAEHQCQNGQSADHNTVLVHRSAILNRRIAVGLELANAVGSKTME